MTQRILFVGQTGELGGAELVLLDIARHYRDRCEVVLLADGPFRSRLLAAGVRVTVIAGGKNLLEVSRQGGRLQTLASAPQILKTAWRIAAVGRRCDVLYPNSQKAAIVTMIAGVFARRPVVWHLHDILSAEHFGKLQRLAVVTLANYMTRRVIANSGAARDAFVAAGGRADRVGVVANGLDPALFDCVSDDQIARLRSELGLTGKRIVGVFSRLSPWKGQHVLIEALPRLAGVHALIVGDALFGEMEYKTMLMRRVVELGVSDRVHWLGFRDDIPVLMRTVDLVLHTSTSAEPFGRVIVEGMLARRPVLATNRGASVELLGEGHLGLVPPDDPTALAEAIERIFATPPPVLAQRVAEDRGRAARMFSVDGMLAGIDRELAAVC
jgi:glycosyltransferase involved in cell wall biosynthesis